MSGSCQIRVATERVADCVLLARSKRGTMLMLAAAHDSKVGRGVIGTFPLTQDVTKWRLLVTSTTYDSVVSRSSLSRRAKDMP